MAGTHTVLPGTGRPVPSGAHKVRNVDPDAQIEVTLTLKAPALPPSDKLPATMSLAGFVRQYGAPQSSIQKVEDTLRQYGLHVEGVSPTGRSLRASGSAAQMEVAFQAGVAIYQSKSQGEFRGREGSVQVPNEIADLVESVVGLDQRRVAQRKATIAHPGAEIGVAHARAIGGPLGPADLEKRYNFPDGDCANQKVAIAEFGSPLKSGTFLPPAYFPDDVTAFCRAQGRPEPSITTVAVNLTPLTPNAFKALPSDVRKAVLEETGEVMMDVEIVASLCSAADVSVYYASWDQKGWIDLLERVTADQPVALSVSYGLAEDSPDWEPAVQQAINQALQAAAMLGITVCVSSGGDGTFCDMGATTVAHVEFPGSSPFVLSVGGTMLTEVGAAVQEVVWWESPGWRTKSDGGGATGGGVSTIFARPAWQTIAIASKSAGSIDGRIVPDIAALAGPPLYRLILDGRSAPNGGTSASAPLLASLLVRLNAALPAAKQRHFLAPLLYQGGVGAEGCTDITSGDNTSNPNPGIGYQAGNGFDAVSGWGVPNGMKLLTLL